jgi:hypothetical protein
VWIITQKSCITCNDAIEGVNQQEMTMGRDHERNRGTVDSDLMVFLSGDTSPTLPDGELAKLQLCLRSKRVRRRVMVKGVTKYIE